MSIVNFVQSAKKDGKFRTIFFYHTEYAYSATAEVWYTIFLTKDFFRSINSIAREKRFLCELKLEQKLVQVHTLNIQSRLA